jgi:uncharacterized cupredoxin-like copper-binding protein
MKMITTFRFGALALAAGLWLPTLALAASAHGGHHAPHGHVAFAAGKPGATADVDRIIEIDAGDVYFNLKSVEVAAGETIRFVITNSGKIDHDFTLGNPSEHIAHQAEMLEMLQHPGMEHDDGNAVMLKPGETKELIWTFSDAENLEFACNLPGHYQAGMKGEIKLSGQGRRGQHGGH